MQQAVLHALGSVFEQNDYVFMVSIEVACIPGTRSLVESRRAAVITLTIWDTPVRTSHRYDSFGDSHFRYDLVDTKIVMHCPCELWAWQTVWQGSPRTTNARKIPVFDKVRIDV